MTHPILQNLRHSTSTRHDTEKMTETTSSRPSPLETGPPRAPGECWR